jgi:uncharacterized repeat protein (TIGR01451 family)
MAIHITGHSGTVEKSAATATLSEKRLHNVRGSLIHLGVNPNLISTKANGAAPAQPATESVKTDLSQENRRVDILLVKLDAIAKLRSEQELQFEIERNEIERLQVDVRAKAQIQATLELQQDVNGTLPVDSAGSLSCVIVNQGENTEEYFMTVSAPKDFDSFLSRATRPDDKVTLLQLAPGEKFKGNVRFRIPAGMDDGQNVTLTLKAISTRFNDVAFQKDSKIIISAPRLRLESKLDKREVRPGEKLRYTVTIVNTGSLPAHALTVKLPLPSLVDLVGASGAPFTQVSGRMLVFTVNAVEVGKQTDIDIDVNVRADSAIGQEMFWNAEVIDGTLQRRAKSTERASIVRVK